MEEEQERETRFIESSGGPFVEGVFRYDPPEDSLYDEVTQTYRRPVYTAGRIPKRLVNFDNASLLRVPVHPRGLSGPNNFPAELWERRSDTVKAAFEQLATSKKYGYKFLRDPNMPPMVRSDISTSRPWPIRTWIASTFLDRAKQVVSESMRVGIVVKKKKMPQEEKDSDIDGSDSEYEDPSDKRQRREPAVKSLTVIFQELMEERMGGGSTDARYRAVYLAGIHFATMVDILVSYTSIFVSVKQLERRRGHRPGPIDDNHWYAMDPFNDLIGSIMATVMGEDFDTSDRGASLAAIVDQELARYSSDTGDLDKWADTLNTAYVKMQDKPETSLFQKWILFAELTAFFKTVTQSEENQKTYADYLDVMEADETAPAAYEVSRFTSNATPLAEVDYTEAQIMTVVLMFYESLWSRPSIWKTANRTLVASDDFYLPGVENYGHDSHPKYTRHRRRLSTTVGDLSSILRDLSKAPKHVLTPDFAEAMHEGRRKFFAEDNILFLDAMKQMIPLEELEATVAKRGRESSNFYARQLLDIPRSSEAIRFWTPFPETQPFTLQELGWGHSGAGRNVPWTAWQSPVGNAIRSRNRGKTYSEATPLPIMTFERVQEAFIRSSETARELLHHVVLDYIDTRTTTPKDPKSPVKRRYSAPPFGPFDYPEYRDDYRPPRLPKALRELARAMELMVQYRRAWVTAKDKTSAMRNQSLLVANIDAVSAHFLDSVVGQHRNGGQWVMHNDSASGHLKYYPLDATRVQVIKNERHIHYIYDLVREWFNDYSATIIMTMSSLIDDHGEDPLGQIDDEPNRNLSAPLMANTLRISKLYRSNPAFHR